MMETTAVGMGLAMTVVAVAVGGLMLEAALLMLRGAFRVPFPAPAVEPVPIDLS